MGVEVGGGGVKGVETRFVYRRIIFSVVSASDKRQLLASNDCNPGLATDCIGGMAVEDKLRARRLLAARKYQVL